MNNKINEKIIDEFSIIYNALRSDLNLSNDSSQHVAIVLAMIKHPLQNKMNFFSELCVEIRKQKVAPVDNRYLPVYPVFASTRLSKEKVALEIREVEKWLRKQKGYGVISIDDDLCKYLAANLTFQQYINGHDLSTDAGTIELLYQLMTDETMMLTSSVYSTM